MPGFYFLRCPKAPFMGFVVSRPLATVGRCKDCDYVITDRRISRWHAELRVTEDGLHVTDLGSRNGTFVDDVPITAGLVRPSQTLRFGGAAFEVSASALADSDEITDNPDQSEDIPAELMRDMEKILTPGKLRVFRLLLAGLSYKEIAGKLKRSEETVHNHIRKIYRAFGVTSHPKLLAAVYNPQRGQVTPA